MIQKKNNNAQVNSKLNRSREGKSDTGRLKDSEKERERKRELENGGGGNREKEEE